VNKSCVQLCVAGLLNVAMDVVNAMRKLTTATTRMPYKMATPWQQPK